MWGLCSSCRLSLGFRGSSSRGGYSLAILWVLSLFNIDLYLSNIVLYASNNVLPSLQYSSLMRILSALGWVLGAYPSPVWRFLYNIGINAMLPSAICQLCAWLLCNIGTIRVKGRLSRISSVSELHRDNVDLPLGAGQQLSMCILNCLLAPAKLGTSEFDTFFIWDCVVIAI